jgi:hypothetical protein
MESDQPESWLEDRMSTSTFEVSGTQDTTVNMKADV